MRAAASPDIVLLSHKDPGKELELPANEKPFESWLAVAQDMWGAGNLTPFDSVFGSRAIGAMAPTDNALVGAICYQLGRRLFTFHRESSCRIEAVEVEPALSRMEKRPKDKVKFAAWAPGVLGKSRLTHLALLLPSRFQKPHDAMLLDSAKALRKEGKLYLADLVRTEAAASGMPDLHTSSEYRTWLDATGLHFEAEHDLSADVGIALMRGLHHCLNMLVNVRRLREPWKSQRLGAFQRELEFVVMLHAAMQRGEVTATGLLYTAS